MKIENKRIRYFLFAIVAVAGLYVWHRVSWSRNLMIHVVKARNAAIKVRNQVDGLIYFGKKVNSNTDAKLPSPGSYKADGVDAVYVAKGATIVILFDRSVLGGQHYFEYIPDLGGVNIYWHCVTSIPEKYLRNISMGCTKTDFDTLNPPPPMSDTD
jgi:hypothetical protein